MGKGAWRCSSCSHRRASIPPAVPPVRRSASREIGSAVEVDGSDGTEFEIVDGVRASVVLDPNASLKTFSDPDVFFDGSQYVLYISRGPSTQVWLSNELHGEYALQSALPDGLLTVETGGVPSGYFDAAVGGYWTFAHVDIGGESVIRRAAHGTLSDQLEDSGFEVVATGDSLGLPAGTWVASPGFAVNVAGTAPPR